MTSRLIPALQFIKLPKDLSVLAWAGVGLYVVIILTLGAVYFSLPDVSRLARPRPGDMGFQVSPAYRRQVLARMDCQPEHHAPDQWRLFWGVLQDSAQGCNRLSRDVARHFYYDHQRKWPSPLEEALLAVRLENELPRKTLLTRYIQDVLPEQDAFALGLPPAPGLKAQTQTAMSPEEIDRLIQDVSRLIEQPQPEPPATRQASRAPARRSANHRPGRNASRRAKTKPAQTAPKPVAAVPQRIEPDGSLVADQPIASNDPASLDRDASPKKKRWRRVKTWFKKSWGKIKAQFSSDEDEAATAKTSAPPPGEPAEISFSRQGQ